MHSRPLLIALLGSLQALSPLTIDMYLPAFPQVAEDLGASASLVALTLTACLLGLALGQLIGGPASDAYGRKAPLLAGMFVFVIASAACATATSVEVLILLRFIQGTAGAFGVVIGRAVVRDVYEGPAAVTMFAALVVVVAVGPIVAPLAGAVVLEMGSWRHIFVVLAGIGFILLVATGVFLRETLPASERRSGGLASTLEAFRGLLGDRAFVGCVVSSGLAFAAMFAYIAGSPFVLQEIYGASPRMFSICFAVNGLGIVLATRLSARLASRHSPKTLLTAGLAAGASGGAALLLSVLLGAGLAGVLPSLFIVVSSIGIIMPNSAALALSGHRTAAGSAAALLGLAQFSLGALAAPLVGLGGTHTAVPMALVIAGLGGLALASFLVLARTDAVVGTAT